MKYSLLVISLALVFSPSVFAESQKQNRGPASVVASTKSVKSLSQGELLLQQVRDPSPSFLRAPAANGPVHVVGICRTANGVVHDSNYQNGYENCMGSSNRHATGALVFGR